MVHTAGSTSTCQGSFPRHGYQRVLHLPRKRPFLEEHCAAARALVPTKVQDFATKINLVGIPWVVDGAGHQLAQQFFGCGEHVIIRDLLVVDYQRNGYSWALSQLARAALGR